jgi:hypothetical protein
MIKSEIFLQKEGNFRICKLIKEGFVLTPKEGEISLICQNTPYFKKKSLKTWLKKMGVSQ